MVSITFKYQNLKNASGYVTSRNTSLTWEDITVSITNHQISRFTGSYGRSCADELVKLGNEFCLKMALAS